MNNTDKTFARTVLVAACKRFVNCRQNAILDNSSNSKWKATWDMQGAAMDSIYALDGLDLVLYCADSAEAAIQRQFNLWLHRDYVPFQIPSVPTLIG
jgi:hypothetical protein